MADKYKFLTEIGPLPAMLEAGLQYTGLREVPGAKSNPVILEMARALGISSIYTNDDISWCAVFINHLIRITGKPPVDPKGDKYNLMRARWLANWGEPVPAGEEKLGDVLVFQRPGGGHVGLYIAESATTFHVFGGNQNNAVNITEIAKSRLVSARRFYKIGPPASARKYVIDSSGKVSSNEA
jgi:uncharacterized protein (TIGR02594 family)